MKDIQNTKGDYGFKINKVGVTNVIHPIVFKSQEEKDVVTIGNFALNVSLERDLKGINMSRLIVLLAELHEANWKVSNYTEDMKYFLEKMVDMMESKDGYVDVDFDYFINKKAPVSEYAGLMPYKCKINAELHKDKYGETLDYQYVLNVEVPITSLCPCSKEISDYSAHNQRGYIQLAVKSKEHIFIEELINISETEGSCIIYPILKRVDEKYVTERAYENPRFVEDIVRLIANKLLSDERISWFKVSSRHQESIHPHDAIAEIELDKNAI